MTVEYFGASSGSRFAVICRICVDYLLNTNQKFCNNCKTVKSLDSFRKTNALGLRYRDECNDCLPGLQEARLKRRKENARRYHIPWSDYNADELEVLRAQGRASYKARKQNGQIDAYFKNNLNARIRRALRADIQRQLKRNKKTGSHINDLGCSVDELKKHIESQFQSGMTWENWGLRGWHIDHIKPLCSFNLSDRNEFLQAVHYTNLQPMWWNENLSKKRKKCD